MTSISSYLTFNGNCREAMKFYQSCLGGELTFRTIGDSPFSEKMPREMKDFILHSTLKQGRLVLMASDMVDEEGLHKGNAVSLLLECSSEIEAKDVYRKLSHQGKATHPVEVSSWGALFGDLTDKYGNHWLIHYPKPGSEKK